MKLQTNIKQQQQQQQQQHAIQDIDRLKRVLKGQTTQKRC